MLRETAKQKLTDLFKENEDLFNEAIESLDSWNGFLGDDRYYYMEDLDEIYRDVDPSELLARAFYGYDEMYTDKDGNYTESFNPNRDYFRYNGYGNLVSTDYKDYSDRLDDYFLDELIDNANHLDLDDEVMEIIDAINDEEDEETEE